MRLSTAGKKWGNFELRPPSARFWTGQERVNDFTNLAFHELTQVLQISIQMAKFTQPLHM